MKRLSRLTALLLAIMLSLSMIPAALAEEVMTKNQLDDTVRVLLDDYYNSLMACATYEEFVAVAERFTAEQREEFFALLTEEEQTALVEKEYALYQAYTAVPEEEILPPAANYTRVARFPKAAPVARAFALRSASSSTTNSNNGLITTKTLKDNGDGSYNITLEAYATGTISVSQNAQPCDIILVLDQSTSMEDSFSSSSTTYEPVYELAQNEKYYIENPNADDWWGSDYISVSWCTTCNAWTNGCYHGGRYGDIEGTPYTPKASAEATTGTQFYKQNNVSAMNRMEALQQAATTFVETVADKENNRIAIVGFHDYAINHTGTGTSALWDATAKEADLKSIIDGIDNSLARATDHNDGMKAAVDIFAAADSTDRKRVVVLFTDGEPEPMNSGKWSATIVKETIEHSYTLKNTYDAAVYVVSVAPGTNASNPTSDMDKYMDYTSSNYPNARWTGNTSSTNTTTIINQITPGSKIDTSNGSYYLTAGDVNALESIFKQIATQTGGSSVALDATAEVRDIVTPYFNAPAASAVSVKTYDCLTYNATTGEATWATNGTMLENAVSVEDGTLTVTGFDFNRNFVAETGRVEGNVNQSGTFHGRKIEITFTITPKSEFWGGNNVPTNGAASGVYAQGAENASGTFDVPHANVPLNVPVLKPENKNIYLLNTAPTASELYNSADFVKQTGEKAWQTAFVNISTTGADGTISNTGDTTVNIEVTVEASEAANADSVGTAVTEPVTQKGEANVYVFKPTMKFQDTTVKYLDPVPEYEKNNRVPYSVGQDGLDPLMVKWEHPTSTGTPEGTAPTLNLTYAPISGVDDDGKITSETYVPVKVTVKIGTEDVTSYTTFEHADCACTEQIEGRKCQWQKDPVEKYGHFLLHVINVVADLTITKSDLNKYAYQDGTDNESAIFTVTATDKTGKVQTWIIALANGESVTIKDLKVNSQYTIAEQNAWTWRYKDMAKVKGTITRDENGNGVTVTIKNEADNPYWLGGDNYATNVFGASNLTEVSENEE